MHHPRTSRSVTIRLPYELETALKEEASLRGRPWQTVLKELVGEALGIVPQNAEVKRVSATALHAATKRLKHKSNML